MFRLLRGYTGDDDAALDLTQQTFIAAFAALERYDRMRPFRVWIARMAVNKAHDWARRRAVRRFFTFARPIDEAEHVADASASAEDGLADRRELTLVMAAIAGLPVNLKDTLLLRTVEGLTQAETAELLHITEKAVETRLRRARLKLAERLNERSNLRRPAFPPA